MDCCNDPTIEVVTWMSSSQVGKTEVLLNVIGYFIAHDASPMLCLQPTQKPMAEDFSKDRLATMVRDTPSLLELVGEAKSKTSGNTILHKTFPGGHITIGGANSPSGLASRPIRVVLADEIDRYPTSAGVEGDPLSLVERRTTTFWNRKKYRTSTPTVEGASRISASFEEGDQRYYLVPCPFCGEKQRLVWSNVKFEMGDDGEPELESVHYECAHCHEPIEHVEKQRMLLQGEWQASKPSKGHASFHISALYSPWTTWAEIVDEWHKARGDSERMKVFTNTLLGECFKEEAKEVEHGPLLERRESYTDAPEGVLLTLATIDVQDTRLEVLSVGFGADEEAWHLEHHVIYGDTTQPQVWEDLTRYVRSKRFKRRDGATLSLAAVGIDSGFQTRMVYAWAATRPHGRVFVLKGVGGEHPIVTPPTKTSKAPVPLFTVGADNAKDLVFNRLSGDSVGTMHFNMACGQDYFMQLTAEKAVKKMRRGFEYREWVKIRPRNEILDLWVYAYAVMYLLNPDWDALKPHQEEAPEEPQPPPTQQLLRQRRQRPTNGGFVNRWRQ